MKSIFVVGAGPAGLFAAQKIALAGHQVFVFNRDIKPGGLAEYGIYPLKLKMKTGLRKQFDKVLALPNIHYYGHVPIGEGRKLTISDLRAFNPAAMAFAVGAQGTKKLGLPGENARGVYSAKDFVYYYNQLPPYASRDFSTGKRVAVVGMGNVMVDIARWLLQDAPNLQTEEVIVIARRGPMEAKFDKKEWDHIEEHLDRKEFDQELVRVKDKMAAVGQDVAKSVENFPVLNKPFADYRKPKLTFRFLSSPSAIHVGPDGRISRLTITENILVERNGGTAAKATGQTYELDVDTMIFAIGDSADPTIGLPYASGAYVTSPAHSDEPVYEVFDPAAQEVIDGTYVVGWARRASDGLVGIARHDGEVGATQVLRYVENVRDTNIAPETVAQEIARRGIRVVTKQDLSLLAAAEQREREIRALEWFKFSDDDEMFQAIEAEKSRAKAMCADAK